MELGILDPKLGKAIIQAAEEIIEGTLIGQLPQAEPRTPHPIHRVRPDYQGPRGFPGYRTGRPHRYPPRSPGHPAPAFSEAVVAERDRANQGFAAAAFSFRNRESCRHDAAARVRKRGRVRIVGLIGVTEHAVRKRRVHRGGDEARADHRRLGRAALGLDVRDRFLARQELRARDHRGDRVEHVGTLAVVVELGKVGGRVHPRNHVAQVRPHVGVAAQQRPTPPCGNWMPCRQVADAGNESRPARVPRRQFHRTVSCSTSR